MQTIKRITDEDFNISSIEMTNPRIRKAARGIVFNKDGNIAVLFKKEKNEYKLIGGGMEDSEIPEDSFRREVLEETGCIVCIDKLLGKIIEEKSQDNFIQESYVYVSHVIEDTGKTNLTEKEIGEGAKCLWLDIDEAMYLIKNSESVLKASKYDGKKSIYHTKFIIRRDYEILKYYKNCKELS